MTYAPTHWNLADIFSGPDSPELDAAVADLEFVTRQVEAARPSLAGDMDAAAFLEILAALDRIHKIKSTLRSYAFLFFADDTANPAAAALTARVEALAAASANRLLFFELWWKALPADVVAPLMAASKGYRYWLESLRRLSAHTLTGPEETIVNLKNATGASALKTVYDTVTNRQRFKVVVGGEVQDLNRGETIGLMRHPDPEVRAATYRQQMRVFETDSAVLGPVYQNLVADWGNENVVLRKFASPISARNRINDIPDAVVATLLEVAQANRGLFQRFFRLKARRIGVERISRYDILAPVGLADKTHPYEEAIELILGSFYKFDQRFGALAERVVQASHVNAAPHRGKSYLNFCSDPNVAETPYINMNYEGGLFDILTLGHELGHAVHGILSCDSPALTRPASLPLAETASLLAEMLLTEDLLAHETGREAREILLFGHVDRLYTGVQRQITTTTFEIRAHDLIRQGATVAQLSDAYLQCVQDQFGDSVSVSDEFRWEWLGIPHLFQWPFYIYAYAFAQLMVLALFQVYRKQGAEFKPAYFRLLSAGGSASPVSLLAQMGIDGEDPAFWQGGYDFVAGLVGGLEQMGP